MKNHSSKSRLIAFVAVLSATGAALRIMKNLVTPVQFINLPLVTAMLAGYLAGLRAGFLTGLTVFLVSDMIIGGGLWTIVDSLSAAVLGSLWGLVRRVGGGFWELFVLAFLTTLAYDLVTSISLYVLFGMGVKEAFVLGVLGLFMPVFGGYLWGVGPVTEFSTAFLTSLLVSKLSRLGVVGK